jgi:glycerol uptake facilitator-like aquaporin
MFAELFAEGLGTFFFLGVILASGGNVLTIVVGLAAAIFLVSQFSSAHLNSTVTLMMLAKGDISITKAIAYIIVQVVGGLLALLWYTSTVGFIKSK